MSSALHIVHGAFGRVSLFEMDRDLVCHAHPQCSIIFKVAGDDAEFNIGGRNVPLTDDTAVVFNAWQAHAYAHTSPHRSTLVLSLYIEPEWLKLFQSHWVASSLPGFFEKATGDVTPQIRDLCAELTEFLVNGMTEASALEQLISNLMIAVIERFSTKRTINSLAPHVAKSIYIDWRLRRAVNLMQVNPLAPLKTDYLAREAGLSRAHFFRMFEKSIGATPHVFLNMFRTELAIRAAVDTNDNIQCIAERLQFSSPAQFSRFFQCRCGIAPKEYRVAVRRALFATFG